MALRTLAIVDLFLILSYVRTRMNRISLKQQLVDVPTTLGGPTGAQPAWAVRAPWCGHCMRALSHMTSH
jgi:hypothetical protein